MTEARTSLLSMTKEEVTDLVLSMGEKRFRADQLFGWLHKNTVSSYEEMKNLPASFRDALKETYPSLLPKVEARQVSVLDGTQKFLFSYPDQAYVESVLMKYKYGWSLCVSSQVGCRMGCVFCASGKNGLYRSLEAGEILGEVYAAEKAAGVRVSHIVIMGMGEPLDNYGQVLRFLRLITHPEGHMLSMRNITVSTCGIVPKIRELMKEDLGITLALSLHAPNDEKRKKIMPIAKKYSLSEVIPAMRDYAETTGRRVTFEYALIRGENDSDQDASELARLIRGIPCLVNLIPVNPVAENSLAEPDRSDIERFKKSLEKYGINVTIRREMGRDIDGACGQLRSRYLR